MSNIELAYIGVEVADVPGLEAILSGVAGLIPGEPLSGATTWRDDHKAHRVIVTEGVANDAVVIGFEASSADDAAAIAARLQGIGYAVDAGGDASCTARRVEGLWRTTSPWGVPVEIVHGLAEASTPFESELMPEGFKTKGVGFGHMVFAVGDPTEAHRFVVDGLGMSQTDWLDLPIAPGMVITGRFYHCNPRHHTLALIGVPEAPPKAMHHFMFETNAYDSVGAAFDRAFAAGVPIASGLGKHDNDKMFSFYVETPAGFQIEVGYGAREIGSDWSENRSYDRISMWGHQPVARVS